jgi:hypothetical protein
MITYGLTKMVDALGVFDQQIPWAWGRFFVRAGSRRVTTDSLADAG